MYKFIMWPNTLAFSFHLAIDLCNRKEKKIQKIVTFNRCFSLKKLKAA